jgi:glycosyltransferase involved in cell wall biosynthesis
MGRLKVLKVMPGVDPCAGAEQSFAITAPSLIEHGVELHLAVFTDRQGLVPAFERAGGVVHDLSSSANVVERYRALRRVIDAVGPDLVHATLWDAAVPAQLAARRSGVPVLVTWANVGSFARGDGSERSWKLQVVHRADRVLARVSGAHFHAVTPGVAELNAAGFAVPAERVHVVERGRPVVELEPQDGRVDTLRGELGLVPTDRVVLCVGRQEEQKDHATLVHAAVALRERHPEARVLLAGREGHASSQVARAVAASGVGDRFVQLGHRDDVPALLELADVFVLSSRYEGAAGSVIEAMRAGLPIVSTDVSGLRGILADGENAVVVPVGDPRALAAGIARVLDDDELAARVGAGARRTFEERFTLDRAVQGLHELYLTLAASGSAA